MTGRLRPFREPIIARNVDSAPIQAARGIGGGFVFNVILQGVSPGAFFNGATALVRMSDLVVAMGKAGIFGIIAAAIACQRGMSCDRSPLGVGIAVKQAVVVTLLTVFTITASMEIAGRLRGGRDAGGGGAPREAGAIADSRRGGPPRSASPSGRRRARI